MAQPFPIPQGAQQQRPPMPQQQAPAAAPQMQGQEVEEPNEMENEGDPGVPTINGEELQMLLFSRLQQLSPDEGRTFANLVTPETVIPLFKMFPELGILFDQILTQRAQGVGQETGGGMPQQGMPPMQQEEPMEEEQNPLVNDNISRGLMG